MGEIADELVDQEIDGYFVEKHTRKCHFKSKIDRTTQWKVDGKWVLISTMGDDHLLNTILYCERIRDEDSSPGSWWEQSLHISYEAMEKERIRRGLAFPLVSIKSLGYRKEEYNGK